MMIQLVAGMISCVGFAYLFNCPSRAIFQSALAGGLGWIMYDYCVYSLHYTEAVATLMGTLVLSIICEALARIKKDAVSVFVIPAILPLVPGAGLYYTLLYLLEGNLEMAVNKGVTTLGCALGIAVGIIVVSSFSRMIFGFHRHSGRTK